jgi:hypothetical protein
MSKRKSNHNFYNSNNKRNSNFCSNNNNNNHNNSIQDCYDESKDNFFSDNEEEETMNKLFANYNGREEFKTYSILKNSVCTVTTNLKIDLIKFTNIFGGKFTPSLSGNRYVCMINNYRYSIIVFDTGVFLLTNLFFLSNLSEVYDFFVNLSLHLLKTSCARLISPEEKRKILTLQFLVQNCSFSFQICPIIFENTYISLAHLYEHLKQILSNNQLVGSSFCEKLKPSFPADHLKFIVKRNNWLVLKKIKSDASTKRNRGDFSLQRISCTIFHNGKFIVTGMQTREDLESIFVLMKAIVDYFFKF